MYPRRTLQSPAPLRLAASTAPRANSQLITRNSQLITRNSQLPRGFTLIELLVVIGIILVLLAIVVVGLRHVNNTAARHETEVEMKICQDMLKEYELVNGLKYVNDAVTTPAPSPTALPAQLGYIYPSSPGVILPVYVDQPQTQTSEVLGLQPAAQSSAIQLLDLQSASGPGSPSGFGDMGSTNAAEARYTAPVVKNTQVVMYIILKDPRNRATLSAIPPKRILEAGPPINPTPTPTAIPPNPIDAAVVLDGWGNPIVFVPRGGVHVCMDPSNSAASNPGAPLPEYLIRSSSIRNLSTLPGGPTNIPPPSPADRPFFMSAGQDGYFTDPANTVDYATDNIYSFQEQ